MRWLHRWVGVTLALFAVLSASSGALLLWSDEYTQWRYPSIRYSQGSTEPNATVIEAALAQASGPVQTLGMPRPGLPVYHLYLKGGDQAYHSITDGSLIDTFGPLGRLPAVLFELHVDLFAGDFGHTLVGMLGLMVTGLLVTGVWIWWPRRRVLRLRRLLPKGTQLSLMNSHAAQGLLISVLVTFLALSGAAIVFHQESEALLNGLLGSAVNTRPSVRTLDADAGPVVWEKLLGTARNYLPNATLRFVSLPSEKDRPVVLRLRNAGELHPNGRSYLVIHPTSGVALEVIDATQNGLGPA
ncbi:MAG: PepSY-associated TM helix domain-containing protein, partial [Pseudomonadota bacterium]